MIEIKHKEDCCGCGACSQVCPQNCIKILSDEEGYGYPVIDKNNCIECGRCEQVCPILHTKRGNLEPEIFGVRNKDLKICRESTSGGFFSGVAEWVIKQGGVVFGAAFDNDFKVIHKYAEKVEDIAQFRGSKYVQSDVKNTYQEVKKFLDFGRWVCYSGTPCQIQGLNNFLGKNYSNLILIDVVCHGVPSPKFFEKYIEWQRKRYSSKIQSVRFRDKYYGYGFSTMSIEFENGSKYHRGMESDILLRTFMMHLNIRPVCFTCPFKLEQRISDFTIFDAWHAERFSKKFSEDLGATWVMCQSEKGKQIWEKIKENFEFIQTSGKSPIELDGKMLVNQITPHKKRSEFFEDLDKNSIDEIQEKYFPMTLKRKLMVIVKPILYKMGIFDIYMRLKER